MTETNKKSFFTKFAHRWWEKLSLNLLNTLVITSVFAKFVWIRPTMMF